MAKPKHILPCPMPKNSRGAYLILNNYFFNFSIYKLHPLVYNSICWVSDFIPAPLYSEKYQSGHNGHDSKASTSNGTLIARNPWFYAVSVILFLTNFCLFCPDICLKFYFCQIRQGWHIKQFHIRRSIEVVITGRTRNAFAFTGTWVRIPPSPPVFMRVCRFASPHLLCPSRALFCPNLPWFALNCFIIFTKDYFFHRFRCRNLIRVIKMRINISCCWIIAVSKYHLNLLHIDTVF